MLVDENELSADLHTLCHDIGERLAGSPAEKRAAEYVSRRLQAAGVPLVRSQAFPCTQLLKSLTEVHEPDGAGWRAVEALAADEALYRCLSLIHI